MIFLWSETKLAMYIEKYLSEMGIPNKVNKLERDLDVVNNTIEQDRASVGNIEIYLSKYSRETNNTIGSLKNLVNDIKNENNNKHQIVPMDSDELQKLIYAEIAAFSKQVYGKLDTFGQRITTLEQKGERKQSQIDISALVNSIQADYTQIISKNIEENNKSLELRFQDINNQYLNQLKAVLLRHEDELKHQCSSNSDLSGNETITQLIRNFEEEQKKNIALTELVNKQSEGIKALTKKIEQLTRDIEELKTEKKEQKVSLYFDEDTDSNTSKILMLIHQAKSLKQTLLDKGMLLDDVYVKLVDNLLDKLNKMSAKNLEKNYAADKLANEMVKIFRQTIAKGMIQEKVKDIFSQYMENCGIRKLDWSIGKKMTNDDYEYLEEPIMYEEVLDAKKVGTIVDIIQDTYVIDYYEDNEKYEAIIPGVYRIGKNIK